MLLLLCLCLQGRSCSRCIMFNTKCSGCVVSRDQPCNLKPGDHLTVEFSSPLSPEQLKEVSSMNLFIKLSDNTQLFSAYIWIIE